MAGAAPGAAKRRASSSVIRSGATLESAAATAAGEHLRLGGWRVAERGDEAIEPDGAEGIGLERIGGAGAEDARRDVRHAAARINRVDIRAEQHHAQIGGEGVDGEIAQPQVLIQCRGMLIVLAEVVLPPCLHDAGDRRIIVQDNERAADRIREAPRDGQCIAREDDIPIGDARLAAQHVSHRAADEVEWLLRHPWKCREDRVTPDRCLPRCHHAPSLPARSPGPQIAGLQSRFYPVQAPVATSVIIALTKSTCERIDAVVLV